MIECTKLTPRKDVIPTRQPENQDLKKLIGNRDVPERIRRSAKRTLEIRTQNTAAFRKR